MAQDEARSAATDPFADVRRTLFPPLQNRKLSEAADALAANQLDIARPLVSKFLAKQPEDPAALNLMADIARRSGRIEEAAQLLVQCIQKDHDCHGYLFNHATALRQLNSFEQALADGNAAGAAGIVAR